jgi:uncharacterized repeat protein (TIGR01451 family)
MKIWQLSFCLSLTAWMLASWPAPLAAREATLPYSQRNPVQAIATVPQLSVAATDVASELANDAKIGVTTPLRVATKSDVQVTPATHGSWEVVPGGRLWRLRIFSEGATDLNLGFSRFHLPEGATLHLSSEAENYTQGAFTSKDNKPHGQLWTPMVPGDRLVVELFVPAGAAEPELTLSQVNRGYRDLFHRRKNLAIAKAAGACNNDVICPAGQPWTNEIRSVAVYTLNGQWTCSGTLINDVAGDKKNFFLTANHCQISAANAATIVIYWNFQSPTCGQHGGGSLAQNQSGAIFRMAKSDVDVTLIELEDVPDLSFRVFYSGWDRSGVAPTSIVGIHHPDTKEKSISFSATTPGTVDSCIGSSVNTHWNVVWNDGVTEPGSSGSGIWNPATHRLIGTLSGGDSSCSVPAGPDCYGKFSVAWSSGTTAATRLQNWLDPLNASPTAVEGLDPLLQRIPAIANVALNGESCSNSVIDPGETVTISVTLTNQGALAMTNLVATLQAGTGVSFPNGPQVYGFFPAGTNISRSFTFVATGACGAFLGGAMRFQLQDGATDLGIFTNVFSLGGILAENFDALTPPLIPVGWTNFRTGTNAFWKTIRGAGDLSPNSIYAADASATGDVHITSAPFLVATTNAQLWFRHLYAFETGFDGGVLEMALGAGPFMDITNSGSFVTNGYSSFISTSYGNPLGGRRAWSGTNAGFITTAVRLSASAAGQSVRLRWRAGTDSSVGGGGWYVDNVFVTDGPTCCSAPTPPTIVNLQSLPNAVAFSFLSAAGQTYEVEFKGSLNVSNWQTLQTIIGDGGVRSFTNTLTTTNRFFRLRSP